MPSDFDDVTVEVTVEHQNQTIDVLVDQTTQDIFVDVHNEPIEITVTSAVLGEPGPPGQQGPPGVNGGSYQHTQNQPSHVWTVSHNLGYKPGGVIVTDSDGQDVEPSIHNINENVLLLTFFGPLAGSAYIS